MTGGGDCPRLAYDMRRLSPCEQESYALPLAPYHQGVTDRTCAPYAMPCRAGNSPKFWGHLLAGTGAALGNVWGIYEAASISAPIWEKPQKRGASERNGVAGRL